MGFIFLFGIIGAIIAVYYYKKKIEKKVGLLFGVL